MLVIHFAPVQVNEVNGQRPAERVVRAIVRLLLSLAVILIGLFVVAGAFIGAGFRRDGAPDACSEHQALRPPAGSGVSDDARGSGQINVQLLPLGATCLYEGPRGQTIEVSDTSLEHTLILAAGVLVLGVGACIPFICHRDPTA